MEYNNLGTIRSCYYYITEEMETVTIENMFNTEILTVKNVADSINFYGFSFASQNATMLNATWTMDTYGPKLTSAENIAHSVRFKRNDEANEKNTLDYIFVYADKYDYGTRNNPIIIRNATEFNGAFGGYYNQNTEIEENFSARTRRIYGDYRIVNNIDLTELIVDVTEESDYKYSLASTKYTLSGELTEIANRSGSINGNGMTIYNLAISNEETSGSSNYGMFKTIESGASISNLNIELAKGGIKADNTACVGTLAGTLADSSLVSIKISASTEADQVDVIGSNIVGGAVGRVIKNSYIFGVLVNNVSVTATYYHNENVDKDGDQRVNLYERNDAALKAKSLAGGIFGVVDIYSPSQEVVDETREEDDVRFANVQRLQTYGNMTISGMTVGGLIGYTGKFVIAKDLILTITNTNGKHAKLIAYECYAGGVVGYNLGYLYQVIATHEDAWQKQIENNMYSYYEGEVVDRGNEELFISSDVKYKPVAIGGIIGVMDNGIVSIGYSKVNVKNQFANYAG
ncbi:MAG: hypothetical protein IJW25_00825, partial [Clostridia bacterium]|nr:hypothetical protein [Clostridia bacterium]